MGGMLSLQREHQFSAVRMTTLVFGPVLQDTLGPVCDRLSFALPLISIQNRVAKIPVKLELNLTLIERQAEVKG